MALPVLLAGGEPPQIVATLLDALLGILRLAFVFARLSDPDGGSPIDMVRVAESLRGRAREVSQAAEASLREAPANWPPHPRMSIAGLPLAVASARLGLQGEIGVIVAG